MTKEKAFEIVFDELTKINLFRGECSDFANHHFMNGVGTVMTVIANYIDEEKGADFDEMFFKNVWDRIKM